MAIRTSRRALLAAASLAAVGTLGCRNASDGSSSGIAGSAEGPFTIWVGSWWEDKVDQITEALAQDHPELTPRIEPLPINGYPDKFTAASLSGEPPDIIDLDATMISTIAAQGLLEPLDDLAGRLDQSDYAQGIWQGSQLNGTQYAIPNRASSTVYFYNKTCFDRAGVDHPTNDWTFEVFLETVQALTIDGQHGIGIAADLSDPANAMDFLAPSIWHFGGDFVNADSTASALDTPESIEGITFWTELYTKHRVAPPGTPNFTTSRDLLPLFVSDKVALVSSGSNALAEFEKQPDLEWGTVMFPDRTNRGGGWTMGIPVGAKNPAAAQVFLEWFAEPERLAALMNRTPARFSANAIPPWNEPQFQVFTDSLEFSRTLPTVPNWAGMQTTLITEVQKVLVGQTSPTEAAKTAAAEMNKLLAS